MYSIIKYIALLVAYCILILCKHQGRPATRRWCMVKLLVTQLCITDEQLQCTCYPKWAQSWWIQLAESLLQCEQDLLYYRKCPEMFAKTECVNQHGRTTPYSQLQLHMYPWQEYYSSCRPLHQTWLACTLLRIIHSLHYTYTDYVCIMFYNNCIIAYSNHGSGQKKVCMPLPLDAQWDVQKSQFFQSIAITV